VTIGQYFDELTSSSNSKSPPPPPPILFSLTTNVVWISKLFKFSITQKSFCPKKSAESLIRLQAVRGGLLLRGPSFSAASLHGAINVVPSVKNSTRLPLACLCRPLQRELCRKPHTFLPILPLPQEKLTASRVFYLSLSKANVITSNDEPNINVT
jgi:hypothetical protein